MSKKFDLDYLFKRLDNPPEDIGPFIKSQKHFFNWKGYGTPELEMKLMHQIFLAIQRKHPGFESFGWQQSNRYNDNYYHFKLGLFELNDRLDVTSDVDFHFAYGEDEEILSRISFGAIADPDPEEKTFAIQNNLELGKYGLKQADLRAFWDYRKKKYKHLEAPCLKFLVVLKLLEIKFSMYYFLYVFGNGTKVRFDRSGVTVTKSDDNEIDGSPLGDGMYMVD